MPEKYSREKFEQRLTGFGTLTFIYDTKESKSYQEIYQIYKQRNEIEIVFDAYKNFLKADVMYMQNRFVTEGWLLANFIAMPAYHKLFSRMREIDLLKKMSPKDVIEASKQIHKLRINGTWRLAEISQKRRKLFESMGMDYLNGQSLGLSRKLCSIFPLKG